MNCFMSALYRFRPGFVASWGERAIQEQDALDLLRTHPGFLQLQDVLDGEERALFAQWRNLKAGDPAIVDLHAEASAFNRMSRIIRQAVNAKHDAAAAEAEVNRQIELRKVDIDRAGDAAERLRQYTQRSRQTTAAAGASAR